MDFQLKNWGPLKIDHNPTLVIFGVRQQGTSFCVRDMIPLGKPRCEFHDIVLIGKNKNEWCKELIPNIVIFDELNANALRAIHSLYERERMLNLDGQGTSRSLLIILDCLDTAPKKYFSSRTIRDLYEYCSSAHCSFSVWTTSCIFDPEKCRTFGNLEELFDNFSCTSEASPKSLLEDAGSLACTRCPLLEQITREYLSLDTGETKGEIAEKIYLRATFRREGLKNYLLELQIPLVLCQLILAYDLESVLSESMVLDGLLVF